MKLRRAFLVLAAAVLALAPPARADVRRFTLDNGLEVILRPVPGAGTVAVLTLFDVGEEHDPPGRSGLAHLIEHLYVTAASDALPARTAQSFAQRYGGQANAQTGRRYTLIAGVIDAARLDEELADAAARLRGVHATPGDLAREVERLRVELDNMYGGIPSLAAMNLARAGADPLAAGARKGGVMEQVRAITLEECTERMAAHYRAGNATLVVVGGFDADAVTETIRDRFAALKPGVAPERTPCADPVHDPTTQALAKPAFGHWPPGIAALAFRMPPVEDPAHPACAILASRLLRAAMPRMNPQRMVQPFSFAPLDDPTVLFIARQTTEGETAEDALAALRATLDADLALDGQPEADSAPVYATFGAMLGLVDLHDAALASNPYFGALVLGRTAQLGLDGEAYRARLEKVTAEELRACAETWFGAGGRAVVTIE